MNPIINNPNQTEPTNPAINLYNTESPVNNRMARTQESEDVNYGCETCANRRYKDRSDDPGVSFQAPTKVAPAMAAQAVMSHEREHYMREESKAIRENKEVISNTINIHYGICPECGTQYVSGGKTRTATREKSDDERQKQEEQEKRPSLDILA